MTNLGIALSILLISSTSFAEYKTKVYSEEMAHSKGLKRDKALMKKLKRQFSKKTQEGVIIPGVSDWTKLASPPENQQNCGSCWSFSITKALRSEFMLSGKDPGRLSFNYLLGNCGGVNDQYGCNGGDFPAGLNMLNGKGPGLAQLDPYVGYQVSCKNLPVMGTALTWNFVGDGHNTPTFKDLAAAIANRHVLSVDVAACSRWANYSSGIFDTNECDASDIDHLVDLVGYSCETSMDSAGHCLFDSKGMPINQDGYLIVQNNWGSGWGENGYMRTRWGMNAIADTAMYFEIKQDPKPSPTPSPTAPSPVPPGPGWNFNFETAFYIVGGILTILLTVLITLAFAGRKND